jgi:cell division control protein 24
MYHLPSIDIHRHSLIIPKSDSALRAEQFQQELSDNFNELLENNKNIARRLIQLEDGRAFDAQSIMSTADNPTETSVTANSQLSDGHGSPDPSTTPVNPTSRFSLGFDFRHELEASRPYRRNANRDSMDFSLRTSVARSYAQSVFSGLSLGDISNLSVIALPIHADDITNSCHYGFGGQPPGQPCSTAVSDPTSREPLPACLEVELKHSQSSYSRDLFIEERSAEIQHPISVPRHISQGRQPVMLIDQPTACNLASIENTVSHDEAFSTQDYDSTWLNLLYPLGDAAREAKAE